MTSRRADDEGTDCGGKSGRHLLTFWAATIAVSAGQKAHSESARIRVHAVPAERHAVVDPGVPVDLDPVRLTAASPGTGDSAAGAPFAQNSNRAIRDAVRGRRLPGPSGGGGVARFHRRLAWLGGGADAGVRDALEAGTASTMWARYDPPRWESAATSSTARSGPTR